jgi:hypothetical protein
MTEFETQLLATLEALQHQYEEQVKAVKELQTAVGIMSEDAKGFYDRMAKDSGKNFREHRQYERNFEAIAAAFPGIGVDTTRPQGA